MLALITFSAKKINEVIMKVKTSLILNKCSNFRSANWTIMRGFFIRFGTLVAHTHMPAGSYYHIYRVRQTHRTLLFSIAFVVILSSINLQ